jgi:hypothetical protein
MMSPLLRTLVLVGLVVGGLVSGAGMARAEPCPFQGGCAGLDEGVVTVSYEGAGLPAVVGAQGADALDYGWRLMDPCLAAAQATGYCSPTDVRECPPADPGRVVGFFVVERRPIVRGDRTAMLDGPNGPTVVQLGQEYAPGDPVGDWRYIREGCYDITALNPPPSGAEVFSYFERLPLPLLTTQHQPPGDGLTGLPVIFYTDSPITQTFTVDI